ALAKVSRSTLSRFENNSGDVQLSSVLRILSVLDMLDRKQEGTILLRSGNDGILSASFAPNLGGSALEAREFSDRDALSRFLENMRISGQARRQAFLDLEQGGMASIPRVLLCMDRLEEYWPVQFSAKMRNREKAF